MENTKCVIVIDEKLPVGLIANTAAILGVTLGKLHPEITGKDICDGDGRSHLGIVNIPVPILKASGEALDQIWEKLGTDIYEDLTVVDFSDIAQTSLTYEHYSEKLLSASMSQIKYMGILIYGNKKKVNKLTGNLPLLK